VSVLISVRAAMFPFAGTSSFCGLWKTRSGNFFRNTIKQPKAEKLVKTMCSPTLLRPSPSISSNSIRTEQLGAMRKLSAAATFSVSKFNNLIILFFSGKTKQLHVNKLKVSLTHHGYRTVKINGNWYRSKPIRKTSHDMKTFHRETFCTPFQGKASLFSWNEAATKKQGTEENLYTKLLAD